MGVPNKQAVLGVDFSLEWMSREAGHQERFLAAKVHNWGDILPPEMEEAFAQAGEGDVLSFDFAPGVVVPPHCEENVLKLKRDQFHSVEVHNRSISPRSGRFYPRRMLHGVAGLYPQEVSPFRVIHAEQEGFVVDLNHPLSSYSLVVSARILSRKEHPMGMGGRCKAWLEELTGDGPGMQARWRGQATDFSGEGLNARLDERADSLFYASPRLVGHVDTQASFFIGETYARHISAGAKVLDLMSSVQSHLPLEMDLTVVGLGLNREELANNPRLAEYVVHDLNVVPRLPFSDGEFHAVVCSLSIEYLIHPQDVFREIIRVLAPGGICMVSFSNRWFPPKVTTLWTELHEFERMGMVLDLFLKSGAFHNLHTCSFRNWPRPAEDVHAISLALSDPVYTVWGEKAYS